jgi:hypothetical protein
VETGVAKFFVSKNLYRKAFVINTGYFKIEDCTVNKKPPLSAFFSLILLSMLLTFCLAIPVRAALSWNVQTVDDNAYTFQSRCPIALDSKSSPHIAYTDVHVEPDGFQRPLVMYANWNGTVWRTQQIAIGYALSLVLDANDHPHILYHRSWKPLMYASWTGSEWNIQTVDPNTFTGGVFGIVALDSYGNPHIAYTDGTTIKYAVSNGTEWSIQTVAQYEDVEIPPKLSFVLDKNDTPYIMYSPSSYADYSQAVGIQALNVTLATYQNSSWKIQPLSLPTPTGDYGNLIVDSKGGLHSIFTQHYVSSENTIRGTILYASWNGTAWNTQTVMSNISFHYSMSLALDPRDYPHISYSNEEPAYASWTGTDWDVQATDVAGYLAVDDDGNLHMSYLAGSPTVITSLMYATATPPATPTSTPTHEPQQTNHTETIMGLAIVVAVLGAGLGLLIYLIKRK